MIEIKGYFLDLLRVWNEIEDPNKKNNLTSLEYNIIKELLGLLKDPDFYYIPQHVEDYEYPRNNLNTFVFHETFVIESDIESYELVSKNIRMKTYTPTIYLYIKEKHRNFENLSLITNNKIKDNILVICRKHNGLWQFPTLGYHVADDKLHIIELFKKRHSDFTQSQLHVNIQECLKITIKKMHDLHKNHIQTINNKNIDFLSYPLEIIDYKVPSFTLQKNNKPDINKQTIRQREDNEYKGALDDNYYYGVRLT
jgi:hypothetical protein